MNVFEKIKKLFKKDTLEQEAKRSNSLDGGVPNSPPNIPSFQEDILKDKNGENIICYLCENTDNETGEYYPLTKSNKITWGGKIWHKPCYRYFKKHSGDLI